MALENIDQTTLKLIIKELLMENPSIIKEALQELIEANKSENVDTDSMRIKKIENLLNKDFDKFDDVFKALA